MADPADVADALLIRCGTLVVASPTLLVAYPDIDFTPPTSGKYLAVSYFPNRPAWEGLTSGRWDQGLLQINVVWPRREGIIKPLAIAKAVMAHFGKGTIMQGATAKVKVSAEPWVSAPIIEPDKTTTPVTIPWTA